MDRLFARYRVVLEDYERAAVFEWDTALIATGTRRDYGERRLQRLRQMRPTGTTPRHAATLGLYIPVARGVDRPPSTDPGAARYLAFRSL